MRRFSLITTWHLDAPVARVWPAIIDAESWPTWWRYVARVEQVAPGDASGFGAIRRFEWRTALYYKITFSLRVVAIDPPVTVKGRASGEVEGVGLCRLDSDHGTTRVHYIWDVRLCQPWMRTLAPVAAPLFRWNHERVMRSGGRSLARLLGARLLRFESRPWSTEVAN